MVALGLHCWCGLPLIVTSRGCSLAVVRGLLSAVASLVVAHGLSCPMACGIFSCQGSDRGEECAGHGFQHWWSWFHQGHWWDQSLTCYYWVYLRILFSAIIEQEVMPSGGETAQWRLRKLLARVSWWTQILVPVYRCVQVCEQCQFPPTSIRLPWAVFCGQFCLDLGVMYLRGLGYIPAVTFQVWSPDHISMTWGAIGNAGSWYSSQACRIRNPRAGLHKSVH